MSNVIPPPPGVGEMFRALVWCLRNGVKAVDYSVTGYWQCAGPDGREIMPSADIHRALDAARTEAMRAASTVGAAHD